jgi:hypothetical protein
VIDFLIVVSTTSSINLRPTSSVSAGQLRENSYVTFDGTTLKGKTAEIKIGTVTAAFSIFYNYVYELQRQATLGDSAENPHTKLKLGDFTWTILTDDQMNKLNDILITLPENFKHMRDDGSDFTDKEYTLAIQLIGVYLIPIQ